MSLEFSRRSFLKYTAVAAVAVAGSSLLTGCGEDAYQPTGKIGSTLELMGDHKMSSAALTKEAAGTYTLDCKMTFKTTSKNELHIKNTCFQINVTSNKKVTRYAAEQSKNNKVSLSDVAYDLAQDEKLDTTLTIKEMTLKAGDTIEVKYWPRDQASEGQYAYTRAYCTWKMDVYNDNGTLKVK